MTMPQEFLNAIETALLARRGHRTTKDGIEFACFEEAQHRHGDRRRSAWWSCTKHCWSCRACGAKGGAFDAANRLGIPLPTHGAREVARWAIRDATGVVVAVHVRLAGPNGRKKIIWERDGTPGLKGLRLTALPLYHAPELATAEATATVVVTEGEKACDALAARGVLAVGTVTGAGTTPADAVLRELCGHDVVLWPDHDEDGRAHMTRIAQRLARMGTSVRWVEWPEAPEAGDAADFSGDAATLTDLLARAAPFAPSTTTDDESPSARAGASALPVIGVARRPLRDVTADALAALAQANQPPRIFARGGELVRCRCDEKGVPLIEPLSDAALRGRLARVADFVKPIPRHGGKASHVSPPLDVVHDLAALDDVIHRVPPLDGIAEIPPLRPDGSIQVVAGYDPATRLIYVPPSTFTLPPILERPSSSVVRVARALLEEVVCDFPFVDQASHANGLAALLTPFVRPLITGCTPLGIFDKPKQGTGASLLAFAIAELVTGRRADTLPAPNRPEEWGKLITAALLAGRTFVLIDNVVAPLRSEHLARAITTPIWEDRLLGESRNVRIPQRATWFATGNNIKLAGDIPRRSYWTRQDAGLAHPEDRPADTFKHPDLLGWIASDRPRLVAAVLTLARHWIVEGRPAAVVPPFGGFESWATVVGGILELAGVEGFLANRVAMRVQLDDEESAWSEFFAAWFAAFESAPVRVRELVEMIRPVVDEHGVSRATPLRDVLPDSVADPDHRELSKRLGQALRHRRDQVFDDLCLRQARAEKHAKVATWRLEPREYAGTAGFSSFYTRGEWLEKYTRSGTSGREVTPQSPGTPPQGEREPGDDADELPPDDEEVLG